MTRENPRDPGVEVRVRVRSGHEAEVGSIRIATVTDVIEIGIVTKLNIRTREGVSSYEASSNSVQLIISSICLHSHSQIKKRKCLQRRTEASLLLRTNLAHHLRNSRLWRGS